MYKHISIYFILNNIIILIISILAIINVFLADFLGQYQNIKRGNKSYVLAAKRRYLRTSLTQQSCTNEDTKSRLNSRNTRYSVHSILFSCSLFKSVKIKIYRPIILPAALYGREIWSLTLREDIDGWIEQREIDSQIERETQSDRQTGRQIDTQAD